MEGRAVGMLVTFFFIVGFAVVVSYFFEIDSKQSEFRQAKERLESSRKGLSNRQAQLDTLKGQFHSAKETSDAYNRLSDSERTLTRQIAELQAQRKAVATEFADVVNTVRSQAVDQVVGTITLANGQGLQQARIMNVSDEEVTFGHAQGVSKVAGADLPPDLREKFRHDMAPYTVLKEFQGPAAPVVAETAPEKPASDASRTSRIRGEIRLLEVKIQSLESSRAEWLRQAGSYQSQAAIAQTNGRPSYNLNAQAAKCRQTAQQISDQVFQIRKEIAQQQEYLSSDSASR